MSFCFSEFSSFGFGGSRRGCAFASAALPAVAGLLSQFHSLPQVFVSCAPGVSAVARSLFPGAVVSSASSFGPGAVGRAQFVQRSAAMVRQLAASPAPLWVCFPGCACPAGLVPRSQPGACWGGFGSGSWAECAFALALGVPVLVGLPAGVLPPASWGQWRECWGCWLLRPAARQSSLPGLLSLLLPVLLFAGLAFSSCARRPAPAVSPVPAVSAACVVQVSEVPGRGQFFEAAAVAPAGASGGSVWFQFQCQFPGWVGAGEAAAVTTPAPAWGQGLFYLEGEFPMVQCAGAWGFWVPVGLLPAGFGQVQWVASGQVGAR